MDRRLRRFVPGPEGLEGRMMLSAVDAVAAPPAEYVSTTATATRPAYQQVAPTVVGGDDAADAASTEAQQGTAIAAQRQGKASPRNRPLTPAQEQARQQLLTTRLQRIDRLPAFLRSLDPGRGLPEEAVAVIQQELRGLVGQLRPPVQPVAEHFVETLRDAIAESSIKPATVSQLNNATVRLLESAGAPEATVGRIVDGLTELARSAASARQPVVVMTNDYALVLQTTLGVGRPITRLDLGGVQSQGFPAGTQPFGSQGATAGNPAFGGQQF